MSLSKKNQMRFITHPLFIILVCLAIGECRGQESKDKTLPREATEFSDAEPPVPFSNSEGPSSNRATWKETRSSKVFHGALRDILTGTKDGHLNPHVNKKIKYHEAVKKVCSHTDYPDICLSTIDPYLNHGFDVMNVLQASIEACQAQIQFTMTMVNKHISTSPVLAAALGECKEQYGDALNNLSSALNAISSREIGVVAVKLSAAMADVSTCESGFQELKASNSMLNSEGLVSIMTSNCLAIASLIPN